MEIISVNWFVKISRNQKDLGIVSLKSHNNIVVNFSILVCLRLQVNPQNKTDFTGIGPERAFADFVFAHIILHLVVMNFIGWELTLNIIVWRNEW